MEGFQDEAEEDMCALFRTTIHSMSADAVLVRQISSLYNTIRRDSGNSDETNHVDDNDGGRSSNQRSASERLRGLDSALSSLEDKVKVLQDIVLDEKRALEELETILVESQDQHRILQAMLKTTASKSHHDHRSLEGDDKENVPTHRRRPRQDSLDPRSTIPTINTKGSTFSPSSTPRKSVWKKPTVVRVRLVTQSELQSVSKTIRGRIALPVINDALLDIERVCRQQHALLEQDVKRSKDQHLWNSHTPQQQLQHDIINDQSHHCYITQQQHHEQQKHHESPSNHLSVSEQCLRRSCAFFRSGEATARTILSVLRTLHRIKQIPGRNAQVTYTLLLE